MKAFIAIMLIAATALAGCATEDAEPACTVDCEPANPDAQANSGGNATADPAKPGTDGSAGDSNETGVAPANIAPTANLTLDGAAISGEVTMFTITVADEDGNTVNWTLDANGDGTADVTGNGSGSAEFTYVNAGTFFAMLNATDGTDFAESTIEVIVAEGAVAGPAPIFKKFDLSEGCDLCVDGAPVFNGADGCIGWNAQREGMDCAWLAFSEEYEGYPFSVFSYTDGNIPLLGNDGNPDIEFRDGCGTSSKQLSKQWTGSGDKETGIIPAGARCIVAYEFHWPNLGHTIEVSIGENLFA